MLVMFLLRCAGGKKRSSQCLCHALLVCRGFSSQGYFVCFGPPSEGSHRENASWMLSPSRCWFYLPFYISSSSISASTFFLSVFQECVKCLTTMPFISPFFPFPNFFLVFLCFFSPLSVVYVSSCGRAQLPFQLFLFLHMPFPLCCLPIYRDSRRVRSLSSDSRHFPAARMPAFTSLMLKKTRK
jgi:hypothetical protein